MSLTRVLPRVLPAAVSLFAVLVGSGPGSAQAGGEPADWSSRAVQDLEFIRTTLADNHPGPVDSENPWFRDWYDRGYQEALGLARRAADYAGYYFAIQFFLHGFQDGHLGALGEDLLDADGLSFHWPGFAVAYRGNRFQVVESEQSSVPQGARLISCDGRSADDLGRSIIQTYHGLWTVRGARPQLAPTLFVDAGNPFVDPPSACRWEVDPLADGGTEVRESVIQWRPIQADVLRTRLESASGGFQGEFGVRAFDGGAGTSGYWVSLPSFALGSAVTQEGIDEVRDALMAKAESIRTSDVLVIDVRGNGGGSSSLGNEIVELIWGAQMLRRASPRGAYADWRVSAGNAEFLRRVNLGRLEERYGPDAETVRDYRAFVEAFEAAVANGEVWYRRTSGPPGRDPESLDATRPDPSSSPVRGKVFLLTDHACFSACLDFADVMRRIPGVTHIGLETRADAVYIDNRAVRLPSGSGWFGFSMKVWRNRARGHNEGYVPEHVWDGDIGDDAALEQWVFALARGSGR